MKTTDEIYSQMVSAFSADTGLEAATNSDLAVRMYAAAAQISALYIQTDWVNRQCFPQTAEGTSLELHAQLRGLERRKALFAEGVLRFSGEEPAGTDREIPQGTICLTAGMVRFQTTQAGVLKAGETWTEVRARAVEAGAGGNVAAGTILSMAVAPVGISRCSNPGAFSGGADAEDDESLRKRILDTYRRLPNGANAAFYQQRALSFDGVAAASVIPRPRGVGTVDVVISSPGGIPDGELLEALSEDLNEKREIAVDLQVRAPEIEDVAVQVKVAAKPNRNADEVLSDVEKALSGWFSGSLLGQDVLRAKLGSVIFGVEGVANYRLLSPETDIAVGIDVLPRLSDLTVEELS